jgi:two-component system sensor histidine kinase KdpD
VSALLSSRDLRVLAGSISAIAVATFVLRLIPQASATTAALALLLVVLGAATLARLRTAIVVSLTALLTLNFFFLPPLGTLVIADPQNWIALFAFLIVAVIASNLSAAAQARARDAEARQHEVARLFAERAQFLAEREAAALVRQKADLASTLLASLSHDLRTPLTAIGVAVENLRGPMADSARCEQADAAMAELDRLTQLFQDILDMARIDADAIRVERQWVTAADVVDAAVAHARHALGPRPLHVDADTDTEVEIDPRIASMALSHVVENAARYSPAGDEIVIRAAAGDDGLIISVADHGPGLDPGEVDQLFERFYRGRAVRQATVGTGMGLSIARGLLTAAGGRIWAENVPAGGARFSIAVPGPVRPVTVPS